MSHFQHWEGDSSAESWRAALDSELTQYTANHYKHGVSSVFAKSSGGAVTLIACIEDHQFQPKNFW
jgi:capping protein (actin filament) muscle Z-line, alpha